MRIGVVGAGIVGLAVARRLGQLRPDAHVVVVEKEPDVARHQSGHNSGVVHAGVYYPPGSLKARLCREGRRQLAALCAERGLPFDERGKVVVATCAAELPGLRAIEARARANAVPGLRWMTPGELAEVEPHVRAVAALHSPHTAITDFVAVARALADDVRAGGGEVRTGQRVDRIERRAEEVVVGAGDARWVFDRLVVCAGLHADRLAALAGDSPAPAVVAFRGEYLRLVGPARSLVRGLVYPVPDPRYPFLGVHLTPRLDGEVDLGPNAVMALAREGYRWGAVDPGDLVALVRDRGVRRMAARHWRAGLRELGGSVSTRLYLRAARRYLPQLHAEDVVAAPAGVRAQAVDPDGTLVDDFRIGRVGPVVTVRNAPSPAATSSLAIAEHLCGIVLGEG